MSHALLNSQQSHPFFVTGIEALSIVSHRKQQPRRLLLHGNRHIARAGVLHAVVQRLLHHAVDAGLVLFGQVLGHVFGDHLHPHAAALRDLARLPFERRDQSQIVQHRRPQQQRHVAHHADGAFHQLLDLVRLHRRRLHIARADQCRKVRHLHQHAGERLSHFVVQFARDRAALLLLRLHQPRR